MAGGDGSAVLVRNGVRLGGEAGGVTLAHTWLREEGAALASGGEGALDIARGATSQFATLDATSRLGGWTLRGGGTLGHSAVEAGGGLVRGLDSIVSTAWSLSAERAGVLAANGRLRLTLGQPLRAERAGATMLLPVGRDAAGNVLAERARVSLSPSGRETRLEVGYDLDLGGDAGLSTWTWLRRHPDHARDADDDLGLAVAYRRRF